MNKTTRDLLSEYKKVQAGAPAATAQPTDDVWQEIERLNNLRDAQETAKANGLVKPRRPAAL